MTDEAQSTKVATAEGSTVVTMVTSNTATAEAPTKPTSSPLNVLLVQSSARIASSTSRKLALAAVDHIKASVKDVIVVERDVAVNPLSSMTEEFTTAIFTPADAASDAQKAALAESDACVAELEKADVIVIGVATYNFNIAATLKCWIDNITRVGKTFQYGAAGQEGLLKGKRVLVCRSSAGTAEDSPVNFSTPYLTQMMGFVGIKDVSFFSTTTLGETADANFADAVAEIQKLQF